VKKESCFKAKKKAIQRGGMGYVEGRNVERMGEERKEGLGRVVDYQFLDALDHVKKGGEGTCDGLLMFADGQKMG